MRILLVGSQAAGALERYCALALRTMGHELLVFDRHVELETKARFQHVPVLYELEQVPLRRGFNRRLLKAAGQFEPDLVFVVKGIEVFAETVEKLRQIRSKPVLINWNPDSPFDFATTNTNRQLVESIPLFDVYFIWDRDLFQPLIDAGARQAEYLPFAYDPNAHAPATVTDADMEALACDVCFVGGYTPERAQLLEALTEFDLRVFGTNWSRVAAHSPLQKHITNAWRGEGEMAKAIAASTITLNFIRAQNGQAHNMRTFEAPAMGGFMLSTRTRDQQVWLPEKIGAAYFSDAAELRRRVEYYVSHKNEAKQIAAEGYRLITTGEHTYQDRMQQVIKVVQSL